MQETWVQFLGWKDPLEKRTATHFSILAWRIPWTHFSILAWRIPGSPWGHKELDMTERLSLTQSQVLDLVFFLPAPTRIIFYSMPYVLIWVLLCFYNSLSNLIYFTSPFSPHINSFWWCTITHHRDVLKISDRDAVDRLFGLFPFFHFIDNALRNSLYVCRL